MLTVSLSTISYLSRRQNLVLNLIYQPIARIEDWVGWSRFYATCRLPMPRHLPNNHCNSVVPSSSSQTRGRYKSGFQIQTHFTDCCKPHRPSSEIKRQADDETTLFQPSIAAQSIIIPDDKFQSESDSSSPSLTTPLIVVCSIITVRGAGGVCRTDRNDQCVQWRSDLPSPPPPPANLHPPVSRDRVTDLKPINLSIFGSFVRFLIVVVNIFSATRHNTIIHPPRARVACDDERSQQSDKSTTLAASSTSPCIKYSQRIYCIYICNISRVHTCLKYASSYTWKPPQSAHFERWSYSFHRLVSGYMCICF